MKFDRLLATSRPLVAALFLVAAASVAATPARAAQAGAAAAPVCTPALVTVTAGETDSAMMHGERRLVVTNTAPAACDLYLAHVAFVTGDGALLPEPSPDPRFGHGPVVIPLQLAPGQRASTTVRWQEGATAEGDTCRSTIALDLYFTLPAEPGAEASRVTFPATVCGRSGHRNFQVTRFARMPAGPPPSAAP